MYPRVFMQASMGAPTTHLCPPNIAHSRFPPGASALASGIDTRYRNNLTSIHRCCSFRNSHQGNAETYMFTERVGLRCFLSDQQLDVFSPKNVQHDCDSVFPLTGRIYVPAAYGTSSGEGSVPQNKWSTTNSGVYLMCAAKESLDRVVYLGNACFPAGGKNSCTGDQ